MALKKEIIRRMASMSQIRFCRAYLDKGSIANRGEFDGNYSQQFFGLLAQVVVGDLLGCERPSNNGEFDGGWDLKHKGKLIDVKCEIRTVDFRVSEFVHNLVGSQMVYCADSFIFVSYNKTTGVFEICGFINKEDMKSKAKCFPVGTLRERTDGTSFSVEGTGGLYEIENKHLSPFEDLL